MRVAGRSLRARRGGSRSFRTGNLPFNAGTVFETSAKRASTIVAAVCDRRQPRGNNGMATVTDRRQPRGNNGIATVTDRRQPRGNNGMAMVTDRRYRRFAEVSICETAL